MLLRAVCECFLSDFANVLFRANKFSATKSFVKVGFLDIKFQSGKKTSFWQKPISGHGFSLDAEK